MKKYASVIVVGLAGAVAAAAIVLTAADPKGDASRGNDIDSSDVMERRVAALETAISEERQARQLLEDELLALYDEIDGLDPSDDNRQAVRDARADANAESATGAPQFRGNRSGSGRRDAMIAAGMSPDRVDYILRRESEIRFEAMQAVFEARNSDEPMNPFNPGLSASAMLRAEIGDAEYETYLRANNRPTSVGISSVMASSPAERAGLQAGDEIIAYDGQRIFSTSELIQHTMAGGDGNAVVDLLRDGSPMQIVVPHGPIGVEIGRFRGR